MYLYKNKICDIKEPFNEMTKEEKDKYISDRKKGNILSNIINRYFLFNLKKIDIKFIGELYIIKVLPFQVVKSCTGYLLQKFFKYH